MLVNGTSLSVASRQGKIEHLERSEGRDLGLRVFVGKRAAIVSSTSLDPAGFASLVERAIAMAKVVPEDKFAGLAETWAPPEDMDLDMADPAEPAPDLLAGPRRRRRGGRIRGARRHQFRGRRSWLRPQ